MMARLMSRGGHYGQIYVIVANSRWWLKWCKWCSNGNDQGMVGCNCSRWVINPRIFGQHQQQRFWWKKTVKSMKMFILICTFPLSILNHMPFSHFHRVISDWGDFCKKEYFLSVKNGLRGICLFREFLHCNVEYS